MTLLLLLACGTEPYPLYFEDPERFPEIASVSPDRADLGGGGELLISGARLAGAKTVVIGGRNARVIEATDAQVRVELPRYVPGGGLVDVAVVTDGGVARLEEALSYEAPGAVSAEVASASLYVYDCPVEVLGLQGAEWVALLWCGIEGGFAHAQAQTGTHPGFAGDLAGFAPLSWLPPIGAPVRYGPGDRRPPPPPVLFDPQPLDAALSITTPRDFARDLAFLQARLDALEERYSYWPQVTSVYDPYVTLWDHETCWIDDYDVLSADGDTLVIDGDATGATGLWLTFAIEEDWGGGEVYLTEGATSTAPILSAEGGRITAGPSGAVLAYDDYSGAFQPRAVADSLGVGDVPPGARYAVSRRAFEADTPLGEIDGMQPLVLLSPDLLSGEERVFLTEPLVLRWEPGAGLISVDIVVWDADVDDPNGVAEVARLVAQGDDATGTLTIPAPILGRLPEAPNRLDADYELTGLWAEVTVARHQLRTVPYEDGELVIDLVHVVNGPVDLVR